MSAQSESVWKPALQTSWQWQLTGPVDQSVDASVYDIDLFDNDAAVVAALHAKGRRVICYFSAGSYEGWRADAGRFPESVKGLPLDGFANERWLDIRRLDILGPIMEARLDQCKAKGFDAAEPDNVDGYDNKSGFPLTAQDQLQFNIFLANAAHARGLSVGLKNDLDQIPSLLRYFDWALNEECFQYNECSALRSFVDAGKAVFQVEYKMEASRFCPQANQLNFNSLKKNISLDAARTPCREAPAAPDPARLDGARHAASFLNTAVAPGELITLFGARLGPVAGASARLTASGDIDKQVEGTQVLFDGTAAPLIYVQAGQVSAAVPYGVAGKARTQVEVVSAAGRTNRIELDVAAAAPGIFTANASGRGPAALLNQDGNLNTLGNPAARGSIVVFYATGEGQTVPNGIDGKLAVSSLPVPAQAVRVRIGDRAAEVLYAGAVPTFLAGLMQINVRVPMDAPVGAEVPLVLEVGAGVSQPFVTMSVSEVPR